MLSDAELKVRFRKLDIDNLLGTVYLKSRMHCIIVTVVGI